MVAATWTVPVGALKYLRMATKDEMQTHIYSWFWSNCTSLPCPLGMGVLPGSYIVLRRAMVGSNIIGILSCAMAWRHYEMGISPALHVCMWSCCVSIKNYGTMGVIRVWRGLERQLNLTGFLIWSQCSLTGGYTSLTPVYLGAEGWSLLLFSWRP